MFSIDSEEKSFANIFKSDLFKRIITISGTFLLSFVIIFFANNTLNFYYAAGLFLILILLTLSLIVYTKHFCWSLFLSVKDTVMLSMIILITLFIAWGVNSFNTLAIPIFIATTLITILIDLRFSLMINVLLSIAVSFITGGDMTFFYMSLISGSLNSFIVSKANQRSKISLAGAITGISNVVVIVSLGIMNHITLDGLLNSSIIVFINGIVSIILTIGLLPFFESIFNVITPMRLLELSNPNQPLIKRLLLEAPGTYHHSLMVGNLAETATEAIGGNALLSRVGAYFHDVGKLKRPTFFIENQLSDNPHDRITPNLSTLVITSHTNDGVELAKEYKIPSAITDIIGQHHGTTLVAFFYHKAKQKDKNDCVNIENFRYTDQKPSTKEAAVVMLADCVEAAVRSISDRTEGKIEGLIRKILKEKLDDGQLDMCELTLKDLDIIARSFMRVYSGYFHEREEYPATKINIDKSRNENTEKLDDESEEKEVG